MGKLRENEKGKIAEANMCLFSVEKSWVNFVGYFCRTVNAVRLKIMCGPPIFSAPVRYAMSKKYGFPPIKLAPV